MSKINATVIQLGRNMWWDKSGRAPLPLDESQVWLPYYEKLDKDTACVYKVVEQAAKEGMNTIVLCLGEGLQYDSHPEIAVEGAWSKAELRELLDHIRKLGMDPVPMLNFSAAHDMWLGKYERMVGTERYRVVCADLIKEVCELFDTPKYFHLGMEEETEEPQVTLDFTTIRNQIVFCRDVKFFCDTVRSMGSRPWLYCDAYNRFGDDFAEAVGSDALLSDYHTSYAYYIRATQKKAAINKPCRPTELIELAQKGYDIVPMMTSYATFKLPESVVKFVKGNLQADQVKGVLNVPFYFCEEKNRFKYFHEIGLCTRLARENPEYFL